MLNCICVVCTFNLCKFILFYFFFQIFISVRIKEDPDDTDDGYYIGLNDIQNEDTFQWSDSSTVRIFCSTYCFVLFSSFLFSFFLRFLSLLSFLSFISSVFFLSFYGFVFVLLSIFFFFSFLTIFY